MINGVISYPIPAYQNLPIEPEFYSPNLAFISAITLGISTIVTTTAANEFVLAQEVRFIIPPTCGSRELNGMTGIIIAINSPNQFVVNINSQNMNLFKTTVKGQQPQILGIGDISSGVINPSGNNPTGTYIPGSYINVS